MQKRIERRACKRFLIPGATLSLKEEKRFFPERKFSEDVFPVVDISRGGLRFLSQTTFKIDTKISMMIDIPDEEPLDIKGLVRWISGNPGKSYKYQIGVQFLPYGEKKNQNAPECLKRLRELESKFSDNDKEETE